MRFERVLVVGAGQMGAGIAQVMAASGRSVLLHDAAPGAVEKGLAAMAKSLEKLAAKGAPHEPADVLGARRARGRPSGRRPDGGGRGRGRRREAGHLPPRRPRARPRGGARLQHVLDPDRVPGRGDGQAGARDRDALLQPGARDDAGRGRPRAGDLRRDRARDRRALRGAGQDARGGERLPGLRLQPDPDAA